MLEEYFDASFSMHTAHLSHLRSRNPGPKMAFIQRVEGGIQASRHRKRRKRSTTKAGEGFELVGGGGVGVHAKESRLWEVSPRSRLATCSKGTLSLLNSFQWQHRATSTVGWGATVPESPG